MDKATPKIILPYITERANRLSTKSPFVKKHNHIDYRSPSRLVEHLCTTSVDQPQFDYCMQILESLSKDHESSANSFADFMATNIVNGVSTDVLSSVDLDSYSITKESYNTLLEAFYRTATCQRILSNQDKLEKRFNVNKVVKDNIYNEQHCIQELCSFIDTYEVPKHYKLNVALENITYTLYKNGISINESTILDTILEYFMMRDMQITDEEYTAYKKVLSDNTIYKSILKDSDLASRILNESGTYYMNSIVKSLSESTDQYIREVLRDEVKSISTEASAGEFIEDVASYLETSEVLDDDKARLGYCVKNIHNFSPVSNQFVSIRAKQELSDDEYQRLCSCDCVLPSAQPIVEKDKFNDIFDKSSYMNAFSEADGFADTEDIKGLINKFKAEQDKSPNKIKEFFIKLHRKTPENIIDDLPDVMSLARAGILLAIAASTPIGPIIAGLLGLVSWLLSKKINDKEATRLLNTIRSEKKKIQAKIDKTSNEKKKKDLEDYLNNLKSCEKKVVDYLDKIEDVDHSDPDDQDDDLDFDFENAIQQVDCLFAITNEVMEFDANKVDLFNRIEECARYGFLGDITDIVKESSISIKDYTSLLESAYENTNDCIIRTAITSSLDKLKREGYEYTPLRSIMAAYIADEVLMETSYQIVNEKFSLNGVKLALQSAKAKLKDLSTKEKSMWQSVDAAGSGFIKSIEKALTSDRREAIIRGNIIPSFSKIIKGSVALAGVGVLFGPTTAIIAALGSLGASKLLNAREKKLLYDEIDTELKVVEKQLEIAQNDGDMNQYRFLLNYQKKLTREAQRIRYGLKVQGRDIPAAVLPGRGGNN